MEKTLEEYCMEMMRIYGGAYEILPSLNVVAVYKADTQELDVMSFEEAIADLEEIRELA